MKIVITKRLRDQVLKLDTNEFWERLGDITEHPPSWLREQVGDVTTKVRFEIVKETEEYGEVML